MAELSYPSPTHNSRNVTEAEYEVINARSTDDGVHGDPTGPTVVDAGIGLQVLVKANQFGVIRGFAWTSGTTDVPLTITGNSSGSTRYDWVVLRLDRATWNVRAGIVQGTPGAGTPAMTQDPGSTGVWEFVLALVTVPNGAASVTVTPWAQYVGARVRPANSDRIPSHPELGEVFYHPDTGAWRGWDGTVMRTIHSDSGVIALSAGFNTWEDGAANVGRRVGDSVTLRLYKRRVGLTMQASDSDGSKIAVLPAEFTSPTHHYFCVNVSGRSGTATINIRPDGEVWIIENQADIGVGRVLALTVNYLIF